MLVPLKELKRRFGIEEMTSEPGAATSGLSRREIGVGPADEKLET